MKKSTTQDKGFSEEELKKMEISCLLTENIEKVNEILGKNADLITRNISLGRSRPIPAVIFYISNLIDSHDADANIIRPLVLDAYTSGLNTGSETVGQLQSGNLITRGQFKTANNINDLINGMLTGAVGLLIEGIAEGYIINAEGYKYRDITESNIEPVVRGPREAFTEVMSVNISLVRRRINSPNLVFELFKIGTATKSNVCMAYMKGLCPAGLSEEIRSRLKRIKIDGVLGSNYIEEFIEDNPYSLFPQVRNSERPDTVAASLLEGKAAIIVDNTPIALIIPGDFFSLLQSAEDYYDRYAFSSLIRLLRYLSFVISLLLPAVYIAVSNFHQEMIPTDLLVSIIMARAQVPIPTFVEAFAMIIILEVLFEAGIRLPKQVGQAVTIVGALVIGQAAVQANVVSPLMVIVVSITAITKFSIPQYNIILPIRILRLLFMLLATMLGLFGVTVGILFLMLHLFSLKSFGKPYMAPLSPFRAGDLKDTAVRFPWWALVRRPAYSSLDPKRMPQGQVPHPPKKKG